MTDVKLTAPSLYVHKRLRKLGGWRTSRELAADVIVRKKGRAMLDMIGPYYMRCNWESVAVDAPEPWAALARDTSFVLSRASQRVASRLKVLRRAGLVQQRIVVEQLPSGAMRPRSEWKAIKREG